MGIELDKTLHLQTLKITLDYLNRNRNMTTSEEHDELIHDLTKVVRFIKQNHIEIKSESNQKHIKGYEI